MKQQNNKLNQERNKLSKDMKSGKISEKEYAKRVAQISKTQKANSDEYVKIYNEHGRKMYNWTW